MDNQALAVLVAVALFGAMAIGIVANSDAGTEKQSLYRYSSVAENQTSN